ncbi:MAG: nucleoside hydrolase [Trueperaceae bacterium]|nr:nucleoside hydrolase [Trueperaceae bacterium]
MNFPKLSDSFRLERLTLPEGQLRVVIDTDTFNEVDDQFAVAHALLSPERMAVEALYAAPYFNQRSSSPKDGMEKSYQELHTLLGRLGKPSEGLVYAGSTDYLSSSELPQESEVARDLVKRAMSSKEPLYVMAIGAITNIASAILLEPQIIERIVVVWLGGHALHWPHTREFNLKQDIHASRIILDSGVPLVLIPCLGVASHLILSISELETFAKTCGAMGEYLVNTIASARHEHAQHRAWSRIIWDISASAYFIDDAWVPTEFKPSPLLSSEFTWSFDGSRPLIRVANMVWRDAIFSDLFQKLAVHAQKL